MARAVARKIMERAHEMEQEEGGDLNRADDEGEEEDDDKNRDEEDPDDEYVFDADEEDNNSFDSDDPRSFGGEYYWDDHVYLPPALGAGSGAVTTSGNQSVSMGRMCRDNMRLWLFYLLRGFGFMILVLQHFFGLNKSRFQWAVDLVEEEKARRDERILSRAARRQ